MNPYAFYRGALGWLWFRRALGEIGNAELYLPIRNDVTSAAQRGSPGETQHRRTTAR